MVINLHSFHFCLLIFHKRGGGILEYMIELLRKDSAPWICYNFSTEGQSSMHGSWGHMTCVCYSMGLNELFETLGDRTHCA
jgi:hypothetical protein